MFLFDTDANVAWTRSGWAPRWSEARTPTRERLGGRWVMHAAQICKVIKQMQKNSRLVSRVPPPPHLSASFAGALSSMTDGCLVQLIAVGGKSKFERNGGILDEIHGQLEFQYCLCMDWHDWPKESYQRWSCHQNSTVKFITKLITKWAFNCSTYFQENQPSTIQ